MVMNGETIYGLCVTAALVIAAAVWAFPSIRRLLAIAVLMAIAAPLKVGGIYPYELLTVAIGAFVFVNTLKKTNGGVKMWPAITTVLLCAGGWIFWGQFVNGVITPPDMRILRSFGLGSDNLQVKIFLHTTLTLLVLATAFWGGARLFRFERDMPALAKVITFGTTAVALSTLVAWVIQTHGVIGRYNFDPPTDMSQGDTARLLIIGAVLCLAFVFPSRGIARLVAVSLFCIHVAAIITIQSRSNYVALLIHLAILAPIMAGASLAWRQRLRFYAIVPVLLGVMLIGGAALATTDIGQSFMNLTTAGSEDLENKAMVIQSGISIFKEHPLVGVGWGHFGIHNTAPMLVSKKEEFWVSTPHNGLVQLLSETGVVGTALGLLCMLLLSRRLFREYRLQTSPVLRCLAISVAFMAAYLFMLSLVQSNIFFPTPAQRADARTAFLMWLLTGVVVGAQRSRALLAQQGEAEAPPEQAFRRAV